MDGLFVRFLKRVFSWTVDEDPEDPMNVLDRRWRWVPNFCAWDWRLYAGISLEIIRFQGKDRYENPRSVRMYGLTVILNPYEWIFSQKHLYYDGPHCFYHFGPFVWVSDGNDWDCEKCMPEGG
jgi:hypothetical protein